MHTILYHWAQISESDAFPVILCHGDSYGLISFSIELFRHDNVIFCTCARERYSLYSSLALFTCKTGFIEGALEIQNQYRRVETSAGERLCRRDIQHGFGLSDVKSGIKRDWDKTEPGIDRSPGQRDFAGQ